MLKNQYNKRSNNVNIMSLAVLVALARKRTHRRTVFGQKTRETKQRKKNNATNEFIGRETRTKKNKKKKNERRQWDKEKTQRH